MEQGNLVKSQREKKKKKMADNFNLSNFVAGDTVCDIYDTYPYVIVAVVHSASATVSALCCIFVIIVIFLLKKHNFFIQRLIIYHCLAVLLHSVALILFLHRLGYNSDSRVFEVLCTISGFLNQLSLWCLGVDFSLITLILLMTGILHKNMAHLERLYVVLIFIFPLTFNWIPFINNSYGRNEAVCWIRDRNFDNCTEHNFGSILQIALWTVPSFLLLVVLVPTYMVIIVFIARQRYCSHWKKKLTDVETETLRKRLNEEVWPLFLFPNAIIVLNIFPLANTIYNFVNPDDPSLALWMLQAIFSPLQGGYIALIYLLDRDTIKRLKYSNVKAAIKQRNVISEYPIEAGQTSDSVTSRDRSLVTPYNQYVTVRSVNASRITLRLDQSRSIIQSHQVDPTDDMTETTH